jgi:acylglycerol lipase
LPPPLSHRLLSLALVLFACGACGGPPDLAARITTPLPAPQGGTHEQGFFAAKDGMELFEQSWRPSEPARGVVVVVHGLKDHSNRYADLAASLVANGFAVYAADLRGHGHSEGIRVYIDSFDQYLDDLDVLLQLVMTREPGKPVFLFGHSMGGAIATLYTIRRAPKLAGLVLSGAALRADVSGFKVFGTGLVAGLSPKAGVFQLDVHDFSRDPRVVEDGLSDPLVYQDGAPARTAKKLLGAIDDIDAHMEDVTVPLLILHGKADRVTPPSGSQELYERARSTDKKLTLYDGLFHDLLHEPERAKVTADIVAWVALHAPGVGPGSPP